MTQRSRAFTLVELLVVIGIIALLISILLPALGRAKQSANTVKCLSNLRQMGMAATIMASERKGFMQHCSEKDLAKLVDPSRQKYIWRLGGAADPVPADWASALLPYLGDKTSSDKTFAESVSKREVFQCPNDAFQNRGNDSGYAIIVNVGLQYVPSSYGVNADIASLVDPRNNRGFFNFQTEIGVYQGNATNGRPLEGRISRVPRAAETALFADMGVRPRFDGPTQTTSWNFTKLMQHSDVLVFSSDDFQSPRLLPGMPAVTDDVKGTMEFVFRTKKLPMDRHGGKLTGDKWRNGKINVAFVDGHAETILQDNLKKVRVAPYKF
jgi:prepilin-type N-terminal cleavage/methylation domain-containing protein/prepilin-type processing-associated H-X9-DG protein